MQYRILSYEEKYFHEVYEIFFLSTSIKEFRSTEHKESFFKKWCGDYIQFYSTTFFLIEECESKRILGYLSGCTNTLESMNFLKVPGVETFLDLYQVYPAHLHINMHPDSRGRGLGSNLVEYFVQEMVKKKIKGVHLITSTDAKNISFYERLHFDDKYTRVFNSSELLFMGKKLIELI